MVYTNRGDKYFILADNEGYFTILKREGEYRSRFFSGSKSIRSLSKHQLNIVFTNENKIGFIRFVEGGLGNVKCDTGNYELVGA